MSDDDTRTTRDESHAHDAPAASLPGVELQGRSRTAGQGRQGGGPQVTITSLIGGVGGQTDRRRRRRKGVSRVNWKSAKSASDAADAGGLDE
jgi:hypothetical protein